MKPAVWALALCAASAWGGDFTGKWSGTFTMDHDGETRSIPVAFNLKQDGGKLEGTIALFNDTLPIASATITGNSAKFHVQPPGDDQSPVHFELTQDGDQLKGEANGNDHGEKRHAKLDCKRE